MAVSVVSLSVVCTLTGEQLRLSVSITLLKWEEKSACFVKQIPEFDNRGVQCCSWKNYQTQQLWCVILGYCRRNKVIQTKSPSSRETGTKHPISFASHFRFNAIVSFLTLAFGQTWVSGFAFKRVKKFVVSHACKCLLSLFAFRQLFQVKPVAKDAQQGLRVENPRSHVNSACYLNVCFMTFQFSLMIYEGIFLCFHLALPFFVLLKVTRNVFSSGVLLRTSRRLWIMLHSNINFNLCQMFWHSPDVHFCHSFFSSFFS